MLSTQETFQVGDNDGDFSSMIQDNILKLFLVSPNKLGFLKNTDGVLRAIPVILRGRMNHFVKVFNLTLMNHSWQSCFMLNLFIPLLIFCTLSSLFSIANTVKFPQSCIATKRSNQILVPKLINLLKLMIGTCYMLGKLDQCQEWHQKENQVPWTYRPCIGFWIRCGSLATVNGGKGLQQVNLTT